MLFSYIKESYKKACVFFENVIFGTPTSKYERVFYGLLLCVLFVIGCVHWVVFYNYGNLSFTAFDWVKEGAYLDTLRDAQLSSIIPWQWKDAYFQTEHFLGNPEIVLTPDIIALRWLSNPGFALLHTLILYSIGFIGSFILAKKLKLTFLSFLMFWLLFNFNGYIVAHLSIGHFQWTGYFLLPFYFVFLMEFAGFSRNNRFFIDKVSVLAMALLLGLLYWNGSFHIAILCILFIFLMIFFSGEIKLLPNAVVATILSIALGLGRLLPAYFTFRGKNLPHYAGYYNITMFFDALTRIRNYDFKVAKVGWWEYDIYIGFFGLAVVGLASLRFIFLHHRNSTLRVSIIFAAIFMALLSFGETYSAVIKIPIPFSNVERVPSRFIIFPFVVLLIIAVISIADLSKSFPTYGRRLIILSAPFIAYELMLHSLIWRISMLEMDISQILDQKIELISISNVDTLYKNSVIFGWITSVISSIAIIIILWKYYAGIRGSKQKYE